MNRRTHLYRLRNGSLLAALTFFNHAVIRPVMAQITNPAVGTLGSNATEAASGSTFLRYFLTIWRGLITIGALTVIVYFLWAGYEWIYAGGDSGKIQKARDKMTQAIIGMIILVGSFVIIGFISQVFFGSEFDLLQLTIPGGSSSSPGTGPAAPPGGQAPDPL